MVEIEQLNNINFLNVYYIASEIKKELEISPASAQQIHIKKLYYYNPNNPNYPCSFKNRLKILRYLSDIEQIEAFCYFDNELAMKVSSQETFFQFCNELAIIYDNRFTKPNANKLKIDHLSEEQIEKLYKILQVITIRLSMSHSPHIMYIPIENFPEEIQQYDLIGLLYKLDKEFHVLAFSKIIDKKPSGQEVEVRIQDNKINIVFKLSDTMNEKYQEITANKRKQLPPTVSTKKEPLEVKIVSGSKIEIENEKKITKYKFPYKLPAGTEWKNIIFQFEDNENIFIQVKQYKHYANYKDMGFLGKGKNPKPSEAWNFLKVLSEQNGEISIQDTKAKDRYKHQKQKLSEMLKSYFNIDSDPFHPYAKNKSYRIKMTLSPLRTNSLNKSKQKDKKEDNLGLNEYYKEQAQEM